MRLPVFNMTIDIDIDILLSSNVQPFNLAWALVWTLYKIPQYTDATLSLYPSGPRTACLGAVTSWAGNGNQANLGAMAVSQVKS